MFSYIDPAITDLLLREGKLRHVDRTGRTLSPEELKEGSSGSAQGSGDHYLSLIGPVPLPISIEDGREALFSWYAFVRHAELDLIRDVADRVRRDQTRDLVPLLSCR